MPSVRRFNGTAALSGALLFAATLTLAFAPAACATTPPNVVLFLADDMGWTDWQYDATRNPTGSKVYETPNLLRLAEMGVNFTNAYAPCPVCSPTRASILTGKTTARTKLTNFLPGNFNTTATLKEPSNWVRTLPGPVSQPNFVNVLKNNGYTTRLNGKWHLGTADPLIYGFDSNVGGSDYGGPGEAGGWFAGPDGRWNNLPGLDTPGQFLPDKYLSDALAEKAGEFIQQNASQPFFLFHSDYQTHIPLDAPTTLITKYQNKINMLQGQGVDLKGHTNATYAAMVEKMDQSLGMILDRLEDPNLDLNESDSILNNTIFIFASDNGASLDDAGHITRNLPLREGKGSIYEGGIRVPLMISHGANTNITPDTTSTARTSLYDLYPTLFDLTGLNAAMPPGNPIDGVNIRAAIEGDPFQRGLLYWHYPHRSNQDQFSAQINGGAFVSAVSDENWKLIFFYEDRHYELYNLTTDPSETTNLLSFNPGIGHELSQALNNYLVNVGALMPVKIATNLPEPAPQILSAPIPGDYDGDTFVTLADYTRWRSDFGSTTLLRADGNGNGVVDLADYVFWRNLFSGSGSGGGSLAGVPEPSSALLFMLYLAGAAIVARKRRR